MQTEVAELTAQNSINYKLSSALTIDNVENMAANFKRHLVENRHEPKLLLDASAVEVITTPGVQMIIALGKILERHSGKLEIITPTEVFAKAFETLGLKYLLEKWSISNG